MTFLSSEAEWFFNLALDPMNSTLALRTEIKFLQILYHTLSALTLIIPMHEQLIFKKVMNLEGFEN